MSTLRLVPLGGLGEIGMNCMAIEDGDSLVLLDCGVMFPSRELGVDVIHPDFTWLWERRDKLRGIVLTHGHEDHMGATPFVLREVPVPVHGPPYALELLQHRLREFPVDAPDLRPTQPGRPFEVGDLRVEPVQVTHSTPGSTALAIDTSVGKVVHTADFNIDHESPGGARFDADRFAEMGDEGVRLLLSDSTNVGVPGSSGSERHVRDALLRLIGEAPDRVVVSLFASNVNRIGSVLAAARATRRKVLVLGRSLHTHLRIASRLGFIKDPSAILVPPEAARRVPRSELLVIATGTQGEPAAALSQLARGTHPHIDLEAGDRVILSSRIIPGHEQTVYGVINALERRGVYVWHRGIDPGVHVSGHACQEELRHMIDLVRPRAMIPVHGTFHHLRRHAELAAAAGVPDTLVVENGAVVEVTEDTLKVAGQAPVGRVHVDAGEAISESVLKDRALLAELGVAVVIVTVDRDGHVTGEPEVFSRGVLPEEAEPEVLVEAQAYVNDALRADGTPRLVFDEQDLEDRARRALRRYFGRRLGRKPLTYATVVRV